MPNQFIRFDNYGGAIGHTIYVNRNHITKVSVQLDCVYLFAKDTCTKHAKQDVEALLAMLDSNHDAFRPV